MHVKRLPRSTLGDTTSESSRLLIYVTGVPAGAQRPPGLFHGSCYAPKLLNQRFEREDLRTATVVHRVTSSEY